jgi:hypothetical protein
VLQSAVAERLLDNRIGAALGFLSLPVYLAHGPVIWSAARLLYAATGDPISASVCCVVLTAIVSWPLAVVDSAWVRLLNERVGVLLQSATAGRDTICHPAMTTVAERSHRRSCVRAAKKQVAKRLEPTRNCGVWAAANAQCFRSSRSWASNSTQRRGGTLCAVERAWRCPCACFQHRLPCRDVKNDHRKLICSPSRTRHVKRPVA